MIIKIEINGVPVRSEVIENLSQIIDLSDYDSIKKLSQNPFFVGDSLIEADRVHNGIYDIFADILGVKKLTLQGYASTCRHFPANKRKWDVSMQHYRSIIRLPVKIQGEFLRFAEKTDMSLVPFRILVKNYMEKNKL